MIIEREQFRAKIRLSIRQSVFFTSRARPQSKVLIKNREVGVLHFLYRGQNEEVVPCIPTLYRGNPSDAQVFLQRMRLVQFQRLLKSHPVVTRFFKRHHFLVNEEGLAQHYGQKQRCLT